jgi:glycosyltransferase involved in cell wall biosynthesis
LIGLSIVIPTYNRKNAILETLKHLEPLMGLCEILVVDDSTDGTDKEILLRYGPRVTVDAHKGPRGEAAATNVGLTKARNDIIVLLGDDDCIVGDQVEFAKRAVSYATERAEIVGLRVIDRLSPRFTHRTLAKLAYAFAGQIFPENGDASRYTDYASNFVLNRGKVRILYDTAFSPGAFNSESDFQLRARKGGARVYYASDLVVVHEEIRLGGERKAIRSLMARNHLYFLRKHFHLSWPFRQTFYRLYLLTLWNWVAWKN